MPTKLIPVGSEFQVNSNIFTPPSTDGTLFDQDFPSIATLSDGRFAVVYESQFNAANTDIDIHYAFVSATGTASGASFVYRPAAQQTQPVAAGFLSGGGFGVAWRDQLNADGTDDSASPNINYRTVSATGVLGPVVAIGDGVGNDASPAIATLSDNRQVVVFADTIGGTTEILLNVVNTNG